MPKTTKKPTKKKAVAAVVAVAKSAKAAPEKLPPVAIETEPEKTAADLSLVGKSAMMCLMLSRPQGATLAELSKTLGWKELSIRGSMSNMVKKGIIKKLYSKKLTDERTYFAELKTD